MSRTAKNHIKSTIYASFLAVMAVVALTPKPAAAADKYDAQEIVDDAKNAFLDLIDHGGNKTAMALLKEAKGVMIFPSVIKGAFIVGGEAGSGVLLTRAPNGTWSYPAFYHLASASFGLQIGGQETRFLLILMTDQAVNRMISGQVEIGGDMSAVAINEGVTKEASTTTEHKSIYYIAEAEGGAFVGVSLEGANIKYRDKTTRNYYDRPHVSPEDVLVNFKVKNSGAAGLREVIGSNSR